LRIVSELREPPREMVQGIHIPGPALLERAAHQLLHDFQDRLAKARQDWRLPTMDELQKLAGKRMPKNPHLDAIIARAVALAETWMPHPRVAATS
jgi:stearoyl-CoA desaturase (Delta-9 desaturase)